MIELTEKQFARLTEIQIIAWIKKYYGDKIHPTRRGQDCFLSFEDENMSLAFAVDQDYSIYNLRIMTLNEGTTLKQQQDIAAAVKAFNQCSFRERVNFIYTHKLDEIKPTVAPGKRVIPIAGTPLFITFTKPFKPNADGSENGWGIRYHKQNGKIVRCEAFTLQEITEQIQQFELGYSVTESASPN